MAEITSKILKSHIDTENLSPIYFFYGDEKYLLKFNAQRIIKCAQNVNFTQFNYNEFTSDNTVDEIADAVMALPFMAEKKFVIVNDFNVEILNATDTNKLKELLEQSSESTCLVFLLPTVLIDFKKSAKWRNFLKLVQKRGDSLNFENMTSFDLCKFIMKTSEKNGSSINKSNATKLIEYVGNDMTSLKNEIEKISAFCEGREITMDDIERLAVKNVDTTVFILIKSIIANDYKKAYELLDVLFTLGEEPVPILARISDNYVDLYRVRAAIQSGKNSRAPALYADYKGREFRLTNAERDIRNMPTDKLRACLDLLVQTDLILKSSKTKGKIVLEELIAKLLIINKGGSLR